MDRESGIVNRGSGIGNRGSGMVNRESGMVGREWTGRSGGRKKGCLEIFPAAVSNMVFGPKGLGFTRVLPNHVQRKFGAWFFRRRIVSRRRLGLRVDYRRRIFRRRLFLIVVLLCGSRYRKAGDHGTHQQDLVKFLHRFVDPLFLQNNCIWGKRNLRSARFVAIAVPQAII